MKCLVLNLCLLVLVMCLQESTLRAGDSDFSITLRARNSDVLSTVTAIGFLAKGMAWLGNFRERNLLKKLKKGVFTYPSEVKHFLTITAEKMGFSKRWFILVLCLMVYCCGSLTFLLWELYNAPLFDSRYSRWKVVLTFIYFARTVYLLLFKLFLFAQLGKMWL